VLPVVTSMALVNAGVPKAMLRLWQNVPMGGKFDVLRPDGLSRMMCSGSPKAGRCWPASHALDDRSMIEPAAAEEVLGRPELVIAPGSRRRRPTW